jgi:two-component system nitrogen regulation sensor histidine kinase NtrY
LRSPSPRQLWQSGIATYLALTGAPPFGPRPVLVLLLLNLDLVLLLALAAVVAKRLFEVRAERRRGLAGSRLQVRLVGLFSLIAVLPTIIVAVFSYLFFSFGVESWFSDKVRTAITESVAVADAYVREHQQAIRADALAMAADLDRSASTCSSTRNISRRIDRPGGDARPDRSGGTRPTRLDAGAHRPDFRARFRGCQPGRAAPRQQGEVVIMTDDRDERVRALVRLGELSDLYLYVGRFIEPRVWRIATSPPRGGASTSASKASAPVSRSPSR